MFPVAVLQLVVVAGALMVVVRWWSWDTRMRQQSLLADLSGNPDLA